MANQVDSNIRPAPDKVLTDIADYVSDYSISSQDAFNTAYYDLLDSFACMFLALQYTDCTKLLGPFIPGMIAPSGSRVPGTRYQLTPIKSAFDIGTLVRWLDFNDTWLAAEWGHPSDNLGAILACCDYMNRAKQAKFTMQDCLNFMIKAHEIQGVLALENSFNRVGLDHVVLVKVASTAIATKILGGLRDQIVDALSQAWVDGQSLRTYRHAPNTGSRKSWAAGDATSRAVQLAMLTLRGEKGYSSALTAKQWGFYDVSFQGKPFKFQQGFGSYVMENVLFKIAFPAEFHAQTAVECAIQLHPTLTNKLDQVDRIELTTQESAVRIISKEGALYNYADRDHCLQYMVAIGLLYGNLTAEHYHDEIAADPRIDQLRACMHVQEDPRYTRDYLDPEKRSIANAVQIFFKDGSSSEKVEIEYPVGHRRRREEGIPLLMRKFKNSVGQHFNEQQGKNILSLLLAKERFLQTPVDQVMSLLVMD
jgi:2-methylcitrate dehydratase